MPRTKRKDKSRAVLRTGESQRASTISGCKSVNQQLQITKELYEF